MKRKLKLVYGYSMIFKIKINKSFRFNLKKIIDDSERITQWCIWWTDVCKDTFCITWKSIMIGWRVNFYWRV